MRDRTRDAIGRQLAGFRVAAFEVGVGAEDADAFSIHAWDADTVVRSIDYLAARNVHDHNIYVRAAGSSGIVLVDDLSRHSVAALKEAGFVPAVLVETSPDNFQAWVRLSDGFIPHKLATSAARILAARFEADPNSADWRHFGRLAGFTNRKRTHRGADGRFPFVRLHEWGGEVAANGAGLLADARKADSRAQEQGSGRRFAPRCDQSEPAKLYWFYANRIFAMNATKAWVHDPDWSRMDWMIVQDMAAAGMDAAAIQAALLHGSPRLDERHKGALRMRRYVEHTVNKFFQVD